MSSTYPNFYTVPSSIATERTTTIPIQQQHHQTSIRSVYPSINEEAHKQIQPLKSDVDRKFEKNSSSGYPVVIKSPVDERDKFQIIRRFPVAVALRSALTALRIYSLVADYQFATDLYHETNYPASANTTAISDVIYCFSTITFVFNFISSVYNIAPICVAIRTQPFHSLWTYQLPELSLASQLVLAEVQGYSAIFHLPSLYAKACIWPFIYLAGADTTDIKTALILGALTTIQNIGSMLYHRQISKAMMQREGRETAVTVLPNQNAVIEMNRNQAISSNPSAADSVFIRGPGSSCCDSVSYSFSLLFAYLRLFTPFIVLIMLLAVLLWSIFYAYLYYFLSQVVSAINGALYDDPATLPPQAVLGYFNMQDPQQAQQAMADLNDAQTVRSLDTVQILQSAATAAFIATLFLFFFHHRVKRSCTSWVGEGCGQRVLIPFWTLLVAVSIFVPIVAVILYLDLQSLATTPRCHDQQWRFCWQLVSNQSFNIREIIRADLTVVKYDSVNPLPRGSFMSAIHGVGETVAILTFILGILNLVIVGGWLWWKKNVY